MKIRPGSHLGLTAVHPSGKVKKIQNEVLRKLKFPEYQRQLNANSICIVCNYTFRDKTRGWAKNIKAICHPFREKHTKIFPKDKNLYLLSESDFIDQSWVPVGHGEHEDIYDFVVFTIGTEQGIQCKGYHILPLIAKAASELGLKGLIIDYYSSNIPAPLDRHAPRGSLAYGMRKSIRHLSRHKIEILKGLQSQKSLCKIIKCSKFVIFPNTRDASPRMIPEVLIRGRPVLVNKRIYGGWKYVNEHTGSFFDGPENFEQLEQKRQYYYDALKERIIHMIERKFTPEEITTSYYSEYGFWKASKRLANVINDIEGHKNYKYVFYTDFMPLLEQWKKYN